MSAFFVEISSTDHKIVHGQTRANIGECIHDCNSIARSQRTRNYTPHPGIRNYWRMTYTTTPLTWHTPSARASSLSCLGRYDDVATANPSAARSATRTSRPNTCMTTVHMFSTARINIVRQLKQTNLVCLCFFEMQSTKPAMRLAFGNPYLGDGQ